MLKSLGMATACLAGVLAPCLLAATSLPALADETYALKEVISLPDGGTLRAFDISFVDPFSRTYGLSASATLPNPTANSSTTGCIGNLGCGPATNPRAVLVSTGLNEVVREYAGDFAGNCSISPNRDTMSGPNGFMIIEKGQNADIWVGDGPKFTNTCDPTSKVKEFSSAKVIDLNTGVLKATIHTGGVRRSDELCYNPVSDVVLIANDDPADNFITFIGEDDYRIIQKIYFNGTDPNAKNLLANGIEQCDFNPRDGKFYINLPNLGPASLTMPLAGVTLRISGEAPFRVEAVFALDPTCGGGSGLKIGPDHQIVIACGGTNAQIIDDRNGSNIALLAGLGGADEVWYDPGSNHYFFGISVFGAAGALGVADAGPPPSVDGSPVITAKGSHSVAADPIKNQVYVPVSAHSPGSTICGTANDAFGNPGNGNFGCILVFTAPLDRDDCIPEGMPVIGVSDGTPQYHKRRCNN